MTIFLLLNHFLGSKEWSRDFFEIWNVDFKLVYQVIFYYFFLIIGIGPIPLESVDVTSKKNVDK